MFIIVSEVLNSVKLILSPIFNTQSLLENSLVVVNRRIFINFPLRTTFLYHKMHKISTSESILHFHTERYKSRHGTVIRKVAAVGGACPAT